MAIEKDLLDQLLAGRDPKDVFNKDGLVDELKKALSERILNTEIDEHLDGDSAEGKSNHRNGNNGKAQLSRPPRRRPLLFAISIGKIFNLLFTAARLCARH